MVYSLPRAFLKSVFCSSQGYRGYWGVPWVLRTKTGYQFYTMPKNKAIISLKVRFDGAYAKIVFFIKKCLNLSAKTFPFESRLPFSTRKSLLEFNPLLPEFHFWYPNAGKYTFLYSDFFY